MLQGVSSGDVRAVHRARVATRRLRELLPVVPGAGEVPSKLERRLRVVTRQLGPLRELDVSALIVAELAAGHAAHAAAFDALAADIERDRAAARRTVAARRATVERARVARRLGELANDLAEHAPLDPKGVAARRWGWAVHARCVGRAERLKRAMATAGAVYLPERLHGVRIALKKLRYALELLVEIDGADKADLQALKARQDVLGRMHDLQMLMERARRLQASHDPVSTGGPALAAVVDLLEDECRRLHAQYVGDRQALAALATRLGGRGRDTARPPRAVERATG